MEWDQVTPSGFTLLDLSHFHIWSRECSHSNPCRPTSRVHKSCGCLNLTSHLDHHLLLSRKVNFKGKILYLFIYL